MYECMCIYARWKEIRDNWYKIAVYCCHEYRFLYQDIRMCHVQIAAKENLALNSPYNSILLFK